MKSFSIFFSTIFLVEFVLSNPPNFDYDFSGFTKKRQLLITNCNDIEGQINTHIGGIQKPTHNYAHIQCAPDDNMGHRMKFITHRDLDNDAVTGDASRQRLEMHASLHSGKGSTFIYAWWFFLSSEIVPAPTFWHIFQIKPSGGTAHHNPNLVFTLRSGAGLRIEIFNDSDETSHPYNMLSLDDATGKWIQAIVKINFSTSGYADVTLKGLTGNLLFHKKINGKFWYDGAEYSGPKWGLYRTKSDLFNDSDFMFFQNVQIWQQ